MKNLAHHHLILAAVALVLTIAPAAAGQKSEPGVAVPKYDRAAEATFKGTVEEVRDRRCPVSGGMGSHLILRSAGNMMPGYSAKEIEIHTEPQRLFISGQQREKLEDRKGKTVHSEQRVNRIFSSIDLPAQIDPDTVKATLSKGELQIELPKIKAREKVATTMKAVA